jgi:hypothetical protein
LRLDGPELLPARGTDGRDHREVARDLVVREYAERMRESALVAQLAAPAGRCLAAAVNAREAVEEALHVVLAGRGVPFTGDKWLHERLRSHAPDLRAAYRPFAALPADEDCGRYTAAAVALCQELTGLGLGLAALEADLRWTVSGLELHRTAGTELLVAPAVGGLWELAPAEAAVWRALVDVAEPADGGAHAWPGQGRAPAETDLLLSLYERGLARLAWDRGVPVEALTVPDAPGRDEGVPGRDEGAPDLDGIAEGGVRSR